MGNVIKIKRGSGVPSSSNDVLEHYELGYRTGTTELYINDGGTYRQLGGGADADTLDGINSTSFLRSDATDTASGVITFSNRVTSSATGGFTIGNYAGYDRIQNSSNSFSFLTDGNAYAGMTFGTVTAGTWQGTAINATYVGNLPASKITSGTFPDARITSSSEWNEAYTWGDHSTAGYLTSFDITTQTDPKYLRSNAADTATGLLTLNGGVHILSGTGGGKLRIKRNSGSTDGDDIVDLHLDDFGLYVDLDNDNDSDQSEFKFRYKTGGSFTNLLAFNSSSISYKGNTIPTISNMDNDRIVTGATSTTIRGESNLKFSGSTLQINNTGDWSYILNNTNSGGLRFGTKDSGGTLANQIEISNTGNYVKLNEDVFIPVAKRLYFGGGNHTYISEDVDDRLRFFVGGAEFMRFTESGSDTINLYHDTYFSDRALFNSGNFSVQHDSNNAYISNNNGNMYIRQQTNDGDLVLMCDSGTGGDAAYITLDGSATLTKFHINTKHTDSVSASFGDSNDLKIQHDGSHSYIQNSVTGDLYIQQNVNDKDLVLQCDNGSGGTTAYITLDGGDYRVYMFGTRMQIRNDGTLHWGSAANHGVLTWDTGRAIVSAKGTNNLDLKAQSGYQVVVNESGSNVDFRVEGDTDTNLIKADAGLNRVGIGTGSPDEKLHIFGAAPFIKIENSTETSGGILFVDQQDEGQNASVRFDASARSLDFLVDSGEAMTILGTANARRVGIGSTTPYERLYVQCEDATSPGIVSNPSATNGAIAYAIGYGDANRDYLCTWGMEYSGGGNVIGYGVKPSTTTAGAFINSADNSNFTRGALLIDNELRFFNSGAITGTIDTAITMTERFRVNTSGTGHFDGDVVAYSTTVSDKRLKENITTIDNALDKVMALRGVEYDWSSTSRKGTHDIGLVAQEVEEVIPELVTEHELCTGEFSGEGNEKTFKTVNYDKMVGVLIEAIKEQQVQINELKTKLGE